MEIKSALMLTAKTTAVFKQDGITPADPFDMGAGRVQVNIAAQSGLVMNETVANFVAANPAAGGNPATLNLASLQNRACEVSCSFSRTFRNPTATAESYAVSFSAANGLTANVMPTTLAAAAGQTASLSISINSLGATLNAWNFGEITLTPTNPSLPTLHMPVAIFAVQPSPVAVTSAGSAFTVLSGVDQVIAGEFTLSNTSAITPLSWTLRGTTFTGALWDQPNRDASTSGIVSTFSISDNTGAYTGDDFRSQGNGTVSQLFAAGFDSTNGLSGVAQIRWSVFRADPITGLPVGDPELNPGAAVFAHSGAPNSPGVVVNGGDITLNLAAAGRSLSLAPGNYWLSVYPSYPGPITTQGAARWNWRTQGIVTGQMAHLTSPTLFGGTAGWVSLSALGVGSLDTVFRVNGSNACGASWLSVVPTSGTVAANGSEVIDFSVNTAGLTPGIYATNICVQSNDANRPHAPVGVTLTVRGTDIFSNGFETAPAL
jgi:hypothetical protein